MESIGERILNLRKELNLNQKELAEKVGITEASLSRYENNLREPKAEIVTKISQALGCSTDYLLGSISRKNQAVLPEGNLDRNNINYRNYKEIEGKILKKLIDENIIHEEETISEEALDKIIKYGVDAAVEILKLKKICKANKSD
ncbi:Helix-turn-helix [Anaerovirgula multivorans]|uniref:Helix-turn-helix n=1 Tax=Anaerovirgula multivorans TaxID=312168 RepID=A0A239ILJ7_9FIRM|nr:helix-turn-helix transcriptional regulator [Anaerovirgula multivorans]SNS94540.1 Helix-turn-helix [Anaerovirgula multivorans]